LLQSLGVAARNLFGEDFWINSALRHLEIQKNYVITDVRFANEADTIKLNVESQIWRIKRNGVEAVNGHVSEHDMDSYQVDMILKNEGTLEDLRTLVRKRMETSLNAN
jgi:hypothetical protein